MAFFLHSNQVKYLKDAKTVVPMGCRVYPIMLSEIDGQISVHHEDETLPAVLAKKEISLEGYTVYHVSEYIMESSNWILALFTEEISGYSGFLVNWNNLQFPDATKVPRRYYGSGTIIKN